MKFSIIICGHDEAKNLDMSIPACLAQDYPKDQFEVIYVDNNSTDGSLDIARTYPIITAMEARQGPSEARNKGMEVAKGDVFVFFDADAVPTPEYLRSCEMAIASKDIGAASGKILPLNPTWISNYLGVSLFEGYARFKKGRRVKSAPSCNLAVKRTVIERVGNFLTDLSSGALVTRFSEDKELCERIRKAGYGIIYDPMMLIRHDNPDTFKRLWNVWVKGSIGRVGMIRLGKTDPFSQLFRYNLPLVCLIVFIGLLCVNRVAALYYVLFFILIEIILSIRFLMDTGLPTQFVIKMILDPLSAVIINAAVLKNRLVKDR